jgi:hypothetical protein
MIQLIEGLPGAVVGIEAVDSESIRRLATIAGWSIPGELQLFSNRDREQAEAWASEGLDAPRATELQGGVR